MLHPIGLRQAIYTAYHATPLAGHIGVYKTYWRIAARYYWPTMYSDMRKAVTECGHYILGNNTSHQAQQILGSLSFDDKPFDIISVDIWIPGVTFSKGAFMEDKSMVERRQAPLDSSS
jgi:Integrase zinc binding domain